METCNPAAIWFTELSLAGSFPKAFLLAVLQWLRKFTDHYS